MIKQVLSEMDKKCFKEFEKRYPGWKIIRYEDNSMKFIPPHREEIIRHRR